MMSFVPGFLDFLQWLIWLFFGALAAVTVFFTFTPVANIVAAPFNAAGRLSIGVCRQS